MATVLMRHRKLQPSEIRTASIKSLGKRFVRECCAKEDSSHHWSFEDSVCAWFIFQSSVRVAEVRRDHKSATFALVPLTSDHLEARTFASFDDAEAFCNTLAHFVVKPFFWLTATLKTGPRPSVVKRTHYSGGLWKQEDWTTDDSDSDHACGLFGEGDW